MRRISAFAAATAAAIVLLAALVAQVTTGRPAFAAAQAYTWKNVQIGGGGFVPDIVFNQSQANLIYARTDIGGVYRWNQATSSWTPLLDSVGPKDWGRLGAASVASDPVDPNRVYVAAGMYTNDWDPNDGAILRSTDKGDSWTATTLPFKLGGNMPGRGMGERLAVDPNKDGVLYLGAPSGNGLWRSTDYGATWAKVTSFPNAGNYAPDPSDTTGYQSQTEGVLWVTFDKSSASSGTASKTIYVGVADPQNTVYRSTDSGATWQRLAGQPTGYIAHKGLLDTTNGYLYIATSDTGGPYDGAHGQVWRYATATGTWTEISPIPGSSPDNYYGYSGLSIDRQHPGTIMVTGYSSWWPDTMIWRSTDSGATWTRIWDWTSYPNRSFRAAMDISSVPWLTFGANPSPPEVTPKLGWMTEGLAIDPFDSDRMMYGTGATIYGTTNLTAWDSGKQITIKPMVKGLEETSALDLISPPTGDAHLLSALGDIGGFRHTNLDAVPSLMFTQPTLTSTKSLDYAELNPSWMVRTGDIDKSSNPNVNRIGFSTDGGANWWQGSAEPPGVTGGGVVAAAADGGRFVWSPDGTGVYYSVGFGNSWTASTGIPAGATVAADRVNPAKFYGFSGGKFYVSTDGGATFTATGATGLPSSGKVRIRPMPGHEGDVWLAGGSDTTSGIWHSTDSGTTFTKLSTVQAAGTIGFGKAASGQAYMALYASATVGGVQGIFRSDDAGATWTRINDDAHQWGVTDIAVIGDPRQYGRVYVATNGRGVLYGDPS